MWDKNQGKNPTERLQMHAFRVVLSLVFYSGGDGIAVFMLTQDCFCAQAAESNFQTRSRIQS